MSLSTFNGRRLTGAKLSVDLFESVISVFGGVLFDSCNNSVIGTEEINNFLVSAKTQRTYKSSNGEFSVFINTDIENIVYIIFIFQPCTPVGNDGRTEKFLACFVVVHFVIHARGPYQLGNDNSFRTVYDESTAWSHQGEVAHKYFRIGMFACFGIVEGGFDTKRGRVCYITFLAFCNRVVRVFPVKLVVEETQYKMSRIIRYSRNIFKNLFQALFEKPLIRIRLNFNEVRHFNNRVGVGKAFAFRISETNGFDIHHTISSILFLTAPPPKNKNENLQENS